MAELFKFRCTQCRKLLGASPSKVGTIVHCPKCRAELIVPPPDDSVPGDAGASPDDPPFRLEDLGLRLDLAPPPTRDSPPPIPAEPSPIAFLEQVAASGPSPSSFPPGSPDPPSSPEDDDTDEEEPDDPPGFPRVPDPLDAPLVSRPRGRRRAQARPSDLLDPVARRRDVVLPRTAAVAWSMFALLGLASAFAAGLMVGHFLWR